MKLEVVFVTLASLWALPPLPCGAVSRAGAPPPGFENKAAVFVRVNKRKLGAAQDWYKASSSVNRDVVSVGGQRLWREVGKNVGQGRREGQNVGKIFGIKIGAKVVPGIGDRGSGQEGKGRTVGQRVAKSFARDGARFSQLFDNRKSGLEVVKQSGQTVGKENVQEDVRSIIGQGVVKSIQDVDEAGQGKGGNSSHVVKNGTASSPGNEGDSNKLHLQKLLGGLRKTVAPSRSNETTGVLANLRGLIRGASKNETSLKENLPSFSLSDLSLKQQMELFSFVNGIRKFVYLITSPRVTDFLKGLVDPIKIMNFLNGDNPQRQTRRRRRKKGDAKTNN